MTPAIAGLSHISLSVRDRDAARHFWVEVLGFELIDEQPTYCFMVDRGTGHGITLTDHDQTVSGPFDEHHTGLDHLAYAVPDVESLLSWEQRFQSFGVQSLTDRRDRRGPPPQRSRTGQRPDRAVRDEAGVRHRSRSGRGRRLRLPLPTD